MNSSGERPRLLVIDDDKKLCRLIADYLGPLGYEVASLHTGPEGVERARAETWQAVILDVMLPGLDGFEVLKQIRRTSDVPVLMLTARGDEADRIVGLEIGADDYLPKTFSTRELLARLRAVARRTTRTAASTQQLDSEIVIGSLHVNAGARAVALDDQPLTLTPVEFDLLLSLARAKGRVKTRDQLLDEIREGGAIGAGKTDDTARCKVIEKDAVIQGSANPDHAEEIFITGSGTVGAKPG